MKRYLPFLLTILFACSSSEENVSVPANLLPKEKMVAILIRTHLIESALSLKSESDTSVALYKYYEKQILKEENVDNQAYETSRAYYNQQPQLMFEIYEAVVDSLNKKERRKELL